MEKVGFSCKLFMQGLLGTDATNRVTETSVQGNTTLKDLYANQNKDLIASYERAVQNEGTIKGNDIVEQAKVDERQASQDAIKRAKEKKKEKEDMIK